MAAAVEYGKHNGNVAVNMYAFTKALKAYEDLREPVADGLAPTPYDPNRHCDAIRVIEWIDNPDRKRANEAFTAGLERQIAYRFEAAVTEPAPVDLEDMTGIANEAFGKVQH